MKVKGSKTSNSTKKLKTDILKSSNKLEKIKKKGTGKDLPKQPKPSLFFNKNNEEGEEKEDVVPKHKPSVIFSSHEFSDESLENERLPKEGNKILFNIINDGERKLKSLSYTTDSQSSIEDSEEEENEDDLHIEGSVEGEGGIIENVENEGDNNDIEGYIGDKFSKNKFIKKNEEEDKQSVNQSMESGSHNTLNSSNSNLCDLLELYNENEEANKEESSNKEEEKEAKLDIKIEDFQIILNLSSGGYGTVDLCKKKKTNEMYAMKKVDIGNMVSYDF